MKKIIFTLLIGLMSATFVQAQLEQGTKYLGGSFNLGFGSSKSSADGTSQDGPKTFNFGITPALGYFISDNLSLGLGIGYTMFKETEKGDGVFTPDETTFSQSMIDLSPFVRYYMMPTEKMGFFCQGTIEFGFGNAKNEETTGSTTVTDEYKASSFGVGITPGIVIFVSEKVALESTFGGLVFGSSKIKWTDDDVDYENSSSNFSLDVNPWVTVGVAIHID
jgi:hypothetical protein